MSKSEKPIDPALAARMNTPAQTRRGANIDPQTASRGMFNINIAKAFGSGPVSYAENITPQRAGGPRSLSKAEPSQTLAGEGGRQLEDPKNKGRTKDYSWRPDPGPWYGGSKNPEASITRAEISEKTGGKRGGATPEDIKMREEEEVGFTPVSKPKVKPLSRKEKVLKKITQSQRKVFGDPEPEPRALRRRRTPGTKRSLSGKPPTEPGHWESKISRKARGMKPLAPAAVADKPKPTKQ